MSKGGEETGEISIHALREEGDVLAIILDAVDVQFLSTPSARRATAAIIAGRCRAADFYPRPPRGGRLSALPKRDPAGYFYPRPPRGGRPSGSAKCGS